MELNPPDLEEWIFKIAEALVSIHSLEIGEYPWSYFYWEDTANLKVPSWSQHPKLWQKAIQIAQQPEPIAYKCFLHRDYHPTNILWQGDRISGVVDWVNACRGPACVDLAHCRGNLGAMYDAEAADRFLDAYLSLAAGDFKYDPYWDLANIIGALPEPDVYPPRTEFSLKGLSRDIIKERADEFLVSVMKRL